MAPTVRVERAREGVDLVTLDRPERLNALNEAMLSELAAILDGCEADASCRVVVLTGAGRAFCAGLHTEAAAPAPAGGSVAVRSPQELLAQARSLGRVVAMIRSVSKPTVAAVNGAAAGDGMAVALACDVRVAAASAGFSSAFLRTGVSSCDMGISWILPRLVGASRAFEILLTGRSVPAGEAERIGLVARVVDDAAVVEESLSLAESIAAQSPFAVRMTKEVMWANLEVGSLPAAMELESRTQVLGLLTEDHREAVSALLARRPPSFRDR